MQTAQSIERNMDTLAQAITTKHFELHPELDAKYGPIGRVKCMEDAKYHLSYLGEALRNGMPSLFCDYVGWAKVMLLTRGIPESDLVDNLKVINEVLKLNLPAEEFNTSADYIRDGINRLSEFPEVLPSMIDNEEVLSDMASAFLHFLLEGKRQKASQLILDAVQAGVSIKDIYLHVFQRSQHEVGRLWQQNKLTVAQEHYCTAATQLIMSQLYSHIFSTKKIGYTLVATCVSGDLHEIGVRMVSDFFEMEGWDTFYLGANVPAASIIDMLIKRRADVLALSATMTYHVRTVEEIIKAVRRNEHTKEVIILVGGYPFNVEPTLWKQIGANGAASDAGQALHLAEHLVGISR